MFSSLKIKKKLANTLLTFWMSENVQTVWKPGFIKASVNMNSVYVANALDYEADS